MRTERKFVNRLRRISTLFYSEMDSCMSIDSACFISRKDAKTQNVFNYSLRTLLIALKYLPYTVTESKPTASINLSTNLHLRVEKS